MVEFLADWRHWWWLAFVSVLNLTIGFVALPSPLAAISFTIAGFGLGAVGFGYLHRKCVAAWNESLDAWAESNITYNQKIEQLVSMIKRSNTSEWRPRR